MTISANHLLEIWDFMPLPAPKPSILFPIVMKGVGTPQMCALTSCIAHLAAEHNIYVLHLFSLIKQYTDTLPQKFYATTSLSGYIKAFTKASNGIYDSTSIIVDVLEQLTQTKNLRATTFLPLKNVVGATDLTRPTHFFCEDCYQEQYDRNEKVHDYLVWSLRPVKMCSVHNRLLTEACPHCRSIFNRLAKDYLPGFCPKCKLWLGNIHRAMPDDVRSDDETLDWERMRFDAVACGQLIANFSVMDEPIDYSHLLRGLGTCIDNLADGKVTTFAKGVHVVDGSMTNLFHYGTKLSLGGLLNIAYFAGVDLANLVLTGRVLKIAEPKFSIKPLKKSKSFQPSYIPESLESRLTEYMTYYPPLTVIQIAEKLKYSKTTFRRKFPEETKQIIANCEEYKALKADELKISIQYGLEEVLRHSEPTFISATQIIENLHMISSFMYKHFPDLRKIASRCQAHKSETSTQQIDELCSNIKRVVMDLHAQGREPRRYLVAKLAGAEHRLSYPKIIEAWRSAVDELGYKF